MPFGFEIPPRLSRGLWARLCKGYGWENMLGLFGLFITEDHHLIFSKTLQAHLHLLGQVSEKLLRFGLNLGLNECQVKFLFHPEELVRFQR